MSAVQPALFEAEPAQPEGYGYRPELISPDEESELIEAARTLPFKPFEFHGHLGLRQVVSFGWRYDYDRRKVREAGELPDFLGPLRDKAAAFAGLEPQALAQALVTDYAPGAPIGWHRDKPQFDKVIGVSLLSACPLRFRRRKGSGWERITVMVEPRSVYLLDGPARWEWEHSIAPVPARRYSITFRSLRPA